MPAIQKRTEKIAEVFPEPKKARKAAVANPVQAEIDSIIAALHDEAFEVPGSKSNREMMIAMAPSILGTPRDQRHTHMESMVGSFVELFAQEEVRLQNKVAETQAKMTEASTVLDSHKAEAETAASNLQAKVDELKGKQVACADSVGVTRSAEATLKDAQFELSHLEDLKSLLKEEQEVAQGRMENFIMFKDGKQDSSFPKEEQNMLKTLATFLRKIKADVSLVAAVPMALGRKPEERSEFDSMTVGEMEKLMEDKLQQMAAEVEKNETSLAEATTHKATSEAALVEAKEKQRAAAEDMLAVKAEQKERTMILAKKKEAVVEQEFVVKALAGEHGEKMSFLKAHQDQQKTLTELVERVTPAEPVADNGIEVTMEEIVEAAAAQEE